MEGNERNLNITLRNEEDANKEEIIISFSAFGKQLKRFLIFWVVAAILCGVIVPVIAGIFTADEHKTMEALISFNYSGIEKGLAPDGSKFDVNNVKNPRVIERTLTEQGIPLEKLEAVRQNITFEGIIPKNIIERFTVYQSVYEQGNIKAAEEILETSYHPTQFRVTFNYASCKLNARKSMELFNGVLENYGKFFFETYGFNEAIGSAVASLEYQDYDYPEQIDVFNDSLRSMQNYISTLSGSDTTRFRSTVTGYTFADLSEAIGTIRSVDLSLISSKVVNNCITKDKAALADYYTRRIDTLTQDASVADAKLKAINNALSEYQIGSMVVYGEFGQSEYSANSAEYDKLVNSKISAQTTLTSTQEQIKEYQKRLNKLKGQVVATDAQIETVEKEIYDLNVKVVDLMNKVNATANEYYETVYLLNSYNILVPASTSATSVPVSIVKSCIMPLAIVEALAFVIYFCFAFMKSLILENQKRRQNRSFANTTPEYTAPAADPPVQV